MALCSIHGKKKRKQREHNAANFQTTLIKEGADFSCTLYSNVFFTLQFCIDGKFEPMLFNRIFVSLFPRLYQDKAQRACLPCLVKGAFATTLSCVINFETGCNGQR